MSTTPVRVIDSKAPVSGRRPAETFRVPGPAWWTFWTLRAAVRHPVLSGGAVAYLWVSGAGLPAWAANALTVCAVGGWLTWWLLGSRRPGGPPRGLADIAVGLPHTVTLRRAWRDICEAAGVRAPRGHDIPRLRRVRITAGGGACGEARVGAAAEALMRVTTLADALGCRDVVVTRPRPGWVAVEAQWADRLARVVRLADLPAVPHRLTFGVDAAGRAVSVEPARSVLIVGVTGSGKSTCVWNLLAAVRRQRIPTRLYVSDAKGGIELAALGRYVGDTGAGDMRVHAYANSPAATDKLIDQVHSAMMARLASMGQRGARSHQPTADEPLCVLIVDEILPLHEQLRKAPHSKLGQILYMGRAAGVVVWAGAQDATVDALGRARGLIPQRIVYKTTDRFMAEAALGTQAVEGGARAWKIPLRAHGVGYVEVEGSEGYTKFRSAYVSDTEAVQIAAGTLPGAEAQAEEETALYRWYGTGPPEEDPATRSQELLLYVGISYDAVNRYAQHRSERKSWPRRVTRSTVRWYPSRAEAAAAELDAIASERPEANIAGAGARRARVRSKASA